MRSTILALLFLISGLASCITHPDYATPKPIAGSGFGAIVYKQIPTATSAPVSLQIGRYRDEDGGKLSILNRPYQDRRLYKWNSRFDEIDHYRFVLIEPGTYAVRAFTQQQKWGLCFHEETTIVDVEPNTISYLGSIDMTGLITGLQLAFLSDPDRDNAKFGNQLSSYYYENIPDWKFEEISEVEVESLETFISNSAEYSGLSIKTDLVRTGSFTPRKAPLTGRRRCN